MLISTNWLSRHVDLTGVSPEELAAALTVGAAEVEGVEPFAPHLSKVVVGYVAERVKHPDADKLSVCKVETGSGEPIQVVCGAPNVDAGQKIAFAAVGTVLPGDLKLKKAKIRGVESRGMICSVRELELGDEHSGIWVLPEDAPIGEPVNTALGLDDWVIEFDNKSLTHRPDLWGHRGIAREIAAIFGRELLPLNLDLPAHGDAQGTPVRIADAHACPRYIALEVDGVQTGRSPEWMRHLLLAVGQRPLDLLVDVSNFVMLDLGQPNHLFDRTRLSPEGINVRMARSGEVLTTLDEEERKLTGEDLLICSGDEPVALAGVMGGEGSKVGEDTSRLLLEIANFHGTTIRRTAARLGLRTDASARFEKSLDPNLPLLAAAHVVNLLRELQPNLQLPSPPTDVGDWEDPAREIELDPARLRSILGAEIADAEIVQLLGKLAFDMHAEGDRLRVGVPSWRAGKDVGIEEDLYEEVARMYGLERLPRHVLTGRIAPPPRDLRRELVRKLQDRLSGGARFHEVLTYSFVSDELVKRLGIQGEEYVRLINPVAEGESRVRRGVVPSLLGRIEGNRRHHADVRLFEIGKGYQPDVAQDRGQPLEVHEVGLVWSRPRPAANAAFDEGLLPRMRGVVDNLLESLALAPPVWTAIDADALPAPWLHPGRSLRAVTRGRTGGELCLGFLGELEPGLHRALGLTDELTGEVALACLSLDRLLEAAPRTGGYRPIPRFPGNKVDVALCVPESVACEELVKAIEGAGKGLVASCELFDLYRGESLAEGSKSLAFHVLLQSEKKTLTDADGQKFLGRLERAAERLGGELRRD